MNASQTKALIKAARQAREILITIQDKAEHWSNPVSSCQTIAGYAELAHLQLWSAIHRAETTLAEPKVVKAVARKSKKIPIAQYGEHRRDIPCPKCRGTCQLPKWLIITDRDGSTREIEHYDATAVAERLRYCACTHSSEHHHQDEMDNLLDCDMPGCGCTHFRYQIEENKQAA
jgi:hypothetical protein